MTGCNSTRGGHTVAARTKPSSIFRTGTEFLPTLTRQRDHAADHGQPDRAALFDGLIRRVDTDASDQNA